MTNGDIIRQLSNKELSQVIGVFSCEYCAYNGKGCDDVTCRQGVYEWLCQEAEDGDEDEPQT